jgi:hypothetical protein
MKFNSKLTTNHLKLRHSTMNRYPVESENIVSIGYDEIAQKLEIEFRLKVIYNYLEVPLSEYVAIMKAPNTDEFYFNFIQSKYHFEIL